MSWAYDIQSGTAVATATLAAAVGYRYRIKGIYFTAGAGGVAATLAFGAVAKAKLTLGTASFNEVLMFPGPGILSGTNETVTLTSASSTTPFVGILYEKVL